MYPLVFAILGSMLFAFHSLPVLSTQLVFQSKLSGEVAAVNFWAYRSAVASYHYANPPGVNGTIPDASLTFPSGYIRNVATYPWTNFVSAGTLYTYSTKPALPPATVDAIAEHGGRTLMIGIAQQNNTMSSLSGGASGFVLPATIPAGAIVVVGN